MAGDNPGRDELVRRARDMAPMLLERAHEAEQARRLPGPTHDAFVEAGFYRIFQPKRWGGYEMDTTVMVDIAAELGRGCASSAWIFTNLAQCSLVTGLKGAKAQEDVWADNPDALCAAAFPGPAAHITRVDGGFMVDGVWNYSSGIDFAEWVNLQMFLRPEDGPSEHRFAAVHRSDFEVVDDWFVSGMAASGSRSLKLDQVFIPDYRTLSSFEITGGPSPGSAVSSSPLYQMPFWGLASRVFSSPLIGIARGVLELTERDLETRVAASGLKLSDDAIIHLRLAESGGEIAAAWALALQDCHSARAMTGRGEVPSLLQRVNWRRNSAYVARMCIRAVDRLYGLAGMRGMAPDSHVQRAWRDMHAGASQVSISWDANAAIYGRARFGLPIRDPRA